MTSEVTHFENAMLRHVAQYSNWVKTSMALNSNGGACMAYSTLDTLKRRGLIDLVEADGEQPCKITLTERGKSAIA